MRKTFFAIGAMALVVMLALDVKYTLDGHNLIEKISATGGTSTATQGTTGKSGTNKYIYWCATKSMKTVIRENKVFKFSVDASATSIYKYFFPTGNLSLVYIFEREIVLRQYHKYGCDEGGNSACPKSLAALGWCDGKCPTEGVIGT